METSSEIQLRNAELMRLGFDAYNSGDYEGLVELLHPDVELHADDELLNGGDFRGREGFIKWSSDWLEAWEDFRIQAGTVEPFGDRCMLVDAHQVARGAGSGVDVDMDVFWAFEAEGGKVRRMHLYVTRERALDAIEAWRAERGESTGS